ncbi:MAG: hypothetical protein H7836_08210 [Magnetococcus sp. YQC-3]
MINLVEVFKKIEKENEDPDFSLVKKRFSKKEDLHALIRLDKLFPDDGFIIDSTDFDKVFISINMDKFKEVATEELIFELWNCGVNYDVEHDLLFLYC